MTYLTQEESFEDTILDTKKFVLNSLIKKLKVDQNGLVEIDFCVVLGNTPWAIPSVRVAFNYIHTWQYIPLSTRG